MTHKLKHVNLLVVIDATASAPKTSKTVVAMTAASRRIWYNLYRPPVTALHNVLRTTFNRWKRCPSYWTLRMKRFQQKAKCIPAFQIPVVFHKIAFEWNHPQRSTVLSLFVFLQLSVRFPVDGSLYCNHKPVLYCVKLVHYCSPSFALPNTIHQSILE